MSKKLYQDEFEYDSKAYTAQEEYLTNQDGEINDFTSLVVRDSKGKVAKYKAIDNVAFDHYYSHRKALKIRRLKMANLVKDAIARADNELLDQLAELLGVANG